MGGKEEHLTADRKEGSATTGFIWFKASEENAVFNWLSHNFLFSETPAHETLLPTLRYGLPFSVKLSRKKGCVPLKFSRISQL